MFEIGLDTQMPLQQTEGEKGHIMCQGRDGGTRRTCWKSRVMHFGWKTG